MTKCFEPRCPRPREWVVFHDLAEAQKPFHFATSVYVPVCTEHLARALRYEPTALNVVRPMMVT
jgi:hypothetical protein